MNLVRQNAKPFRSKKRLNMPLINFFFWKQITVNSLILSLYKGLKLEYYSFQWTPSVILTNNLWMTLRLTRSTTYIRYPELGVWKASVTAKSEVCFLTSNFIKRVPVSVINLSYTRVKTTRGFGYENLYRSRILNTHMAVKINPFLIFFTHPTHTDTNKHLSFTNLRILLFTIATPHILHPLLREGEK